MLMARTDSSNRNRGRGRSNNRIAANSDGMLSEARRLMTMIFAIIMLLVALMAWLLWTCHELYDRRFWLWRFGA